MISLRSPWCLHFNILAFFEVHYNSNRLGVRLVGPKPIWTRTDGGEAGLHPSNIHDCEYAIGTVNFTGDMPVILTQDGPSLGGFVCLVTIAKAELWKVGQVKPGDTIRFIPISFDEAVELEKRQLAIIETLICPEFTQKQSAVCCLNNSFIHFSLMALFLVNLIID